MSIVDSNAREHRKQELWALGTAPPPVTGMTLLTDRILQRLRLTGPVQFFDWSPGTFNTGFLPRARRVSRVIRSIVELLQRGRVEGQRLYLVANSRAGLYLTLLIVFVARRLGYFVFLHHHVYSYIDEYDWRMSRIDRLMGEHGAHVVHCEKMVNDFRSQYKSGSKFCIVYPSALAIQTQNSRTRASRPFRLGLLSNLTHAKGLDLVIQTFLALHENGRDVSLDLAGPVRTKAANELLQQILVAYPNQVRYLGPVYNGDKLRFFADIDVFLFPTRNESWGIVLNEALAAGLPVVTCDRGCVATVVGPHAGLVVSDPFAYTAEAVQQIEHWMDNEVAYRNASEAAIEQAKYLHREGDRTLAQFARHMFTPAMNNSLSMV